MAFCFQYCCCVHIYSTSLVFFVVVVVVLQSTEVASQITEHPMNQTVPIGQNTTFRCIGTQDPVWIVNIATGMRYTTDRLRDIRLLREIGITSQRHQNGELILTVLATVANNNSNVTCRVFVSDAVNFSHVAKLTVLGGSLLLLHFCLFVCMQYCLSNCRQ